MNWNRLVENRLKAAMEAGDFEDLSGIGQPLHLVSESHIDPAWRLALHLLQNAGMAPIWVEMTRDILEELRSSREDLLVAARRWDEARPEWSRATLRFQDRITALNKRVADLNLRVPHAAFLLPRLNPTVEQRKVLESSFEKGDHTD